MSRSPEMQKQTKPILLFNDECAVCCRIGHWVQESAPNRVRPAPPCNRLATIRGALMNLRKSKTNPRIRNLR